MFDTISFFFFFNDTATTEIYTLSLHDALPIERMATPGGGCQAEQPTLPGFHHDLLRGPPARRGLILDLRAAGPGRTQVRWRAITTGWHPQSDRATPAQRRRSGPAWQRSVPTAPPGTFARRAEPPIMATRPPGRIPSEAAQ